MKTIISVIVTHHLPENKKYLDLCLKSLERAKEYFEVQTHQQATVEIICVSSYLIEGITLRPTISWVIDPDADNWHKKMLLGIGIANPETKTYQFVADDVFVSQNIFTDLFEIAFAAEEEKPFIMNAFSNNEIGFHLLPTLTLPSTPRGKPPTTLWLKPQHDYEEGEGVYYSVQNYQGWPRAQWIQRYPRFVPFFCTMIPKKVWDEVGGMDPLLHNRHNDQDFCYRAEQKGYLSVISMGSFAFHFGTKTLNKVHSPEEMNQASAHFKKKWGFT